MSASPLSRVGLPATDDAPPASDGNRKAVLGIVGLLLAGAALGASLLLGGGDDLEDLGTPPAAAAAQPPASPSASPSAAPPAFPDDSTARDGRDPFAALYVEPAPATGVAAGAPAVADGTPDAAAPVAPAPVPEAVPVGTGEVPAPSVGTGVSTIALLRTEGADPSRTAVFTVDGAQVAVAVGESFGPGDGLLLLSLQQGPAAGGWTAVVQSGQGEPFDVVSGTPVAVP